MAQEIPQGEPAEEEMFPEIRVTLSRGDFLYFNWVLALQRPILPFFLYSFVLFNLASFLGVWPAGRVFALAILVPAVGYGIFVHLSAQGLWQRAPQIRQPRSYRFRQQTYGSKGEAWQWTPYGEVRGVLESRRGFYLQRPDGTFDLLHHSALKDRGAFAEFLASKGLSVRRARFL